MIPEQKAKLDKIRQDMKITNDGYLKAWQGVIEAMKKFKEACNEYAIKNGAKI